MSTYSQDRLENKILQSIGLLIVSRTIKNHKISTLVSPTRVDLSADNSSCTVYVSGFVEEEKIQESIDGLNQSKSFIQKKIASVLKTKNTPKLHFVRDESEIKKQEIEHLLDKIKQ